MIKIKISYNTDEELAGVIRLLSPALKSWKRSRNMEGRYKKAYVELEHVTKPGRSMKKKYPNLIPNSERSPEELREMGRKGGIKSGEARRKKRDQEKTARMLTDILSNSPEFKARMEELVKMLGGK